MREKQGRKLGVRVKRETETKRKRF